MRQSFECSLDLKAHALGPGEGSTQSDVNACRHGLRAYSRRGIDGVCPLTIAVERAPGWLVTAQTGRFQRPAAASGTLQAAVQPSLGASVPSACPSPSFHQTELTSPKQTWHKAESLANDRDALGNLRRGLQGLSKMLEDESRLPAPHLCLSFAASQQIYTAVSKIAATSHDEGMVRDAVQLYNALLDSEEEDFLENDVFAASLMNFIRRSIASITLGEDIEADIVELLFGIAAKIRLQPEILPVWFTSAAADASGRLVNQKTDFAGVTQKEDFPLCYQLIDKVHHEGRIGEFARMGLLYIFESASKSLPLEQWIVNSDLPTLMATGLGALYSQLSRLVLSCSVICYFATID